MTYGYLGRRGQGKTTWAVRDLMDRMRDGRRVVSNTPIKFIEHGKVFAAQYIDDREEYKRRFLKDINCDIFCDEASVFLPAQFWHKLSQSFIERFAQERKMNTNLYYTSQGWKHTVTRLRDMTDVAIICQKKKFPPIPDIKIRWWSRKEFRYKSWRHYWARYFVSRRVLPEYFKTTSTRWEVLDKFVLNKRTMYPAQYRHIFRAFDTGKMIAGSGLTKDEGLGTEDLKEMAPENWDRFIEENYSEFDSTEEIGQQTDDEV